MGKRTQWAPPVAQWRTKKWVAQVSAWLDNGEHLSIITIVTCLPLASGRPNRAPLY